MNQTEWKKAIALLLKVVRKERGNTQIQFAQILGVSRINYQKYENGTRKIPAHLFMYLSQVIGIDLNRVLADSKVLGDIFDY